MSPARTIDGITLTDQTDFAAFARDVLRGEGGVGSRRTEAQQPGRAAPLIAELAGADRDWVVANAEPIVRGTPAAGATLLIQLQTTVADLVALGRRIVPLCHGDRRFEIDVSRFIDDPAVRQQLLDLFHASAPS